MRTLYTICSIFCKPKTALKYSLLILKPLQKPKCFKKWSDNLHWYQDREKNYPQQEAKPLPIKNLPQIGAADSLVRYALRLNVPHFNALAPGNKNQIRHTSWSRQALGASPEAQWPHEKHDHVTLTSKQQASPLCCEELRASLATYWKWRQYGCRSSGLRDDTGFCHLLSSSTLLPLPAGLLLLYKVASTSSSTFPLQSTSCLTLHTPLIQD